jgi:hypothetical protein
MTALKHECAAARQRGAGPDAAAKIHARRPFRSWTDHDGAYRFEGTLTPDKSARSQKTLDGFTDQVFQDAQRAAIHDSHEQYAADALTRIADAAIANTTGNCSAAPKLLCLARASGLARGSESVASDRARERGTRAPASRSRCEGPMRVSDRGDPRRDNLARRSHGHGPPATTASPSSAATTTTSRATSTGPTAHNSPTANAH